MSLVFFDVKDKSITERIALLYSHVFPFSENSVFIATLNGLKNATRRIINKYDENEIYEMKKIQAF